MVRYYHLLHNLSELGMMIQLLTLSDWFLNQISEEFFLPEIV